MGLSRLSLGLLPGLGFALFLLLETFLFGSTALCLGDKRPALNVVPGFLFFFTLKVLNTIDLDPIFRYLTIRYGLSSGMLGPEGAKNLCGGLILGYFTTGLAAFKKCTATYQEGHSQ